MNFIIGENVCRLCSKPGHNYHFIFAKKANSILQKMRNCLPIEVHVNDRLPAYVCNACLEALDISDKLRCQCLRADSKFRKQLGMILMEQTKQMRDPLYIDCDALFEESNKCNELMNDHQTIGWICEFCGYGFTSSDDLIHHQTEEHNEKEYIKNIEQDYEKFENSIGGVVFEDSLDIKDEAILCPEDTSIFSEQECFLISDEDRRKITCPICYAVIEDTYLMELHTKFHKPRSMFCNQCQRYHLSPYDLYIHKRNTHNMWHDEQMMWFCERCEILASNPTHIKDHLQKCTKPKFLCNHCDREFIFEDELELHHVRSHSGHSIRTTVNDSYIVKFKCQLCDKLCITNDDYNQHLLSHLAMKDEKYKCTECNENLASSHDLKDHIDNVHRIQNLLKCNICSKTFSNDDEVQQHNERMHKDLFRDDNTQPLKGERFYVCKICCKTSTNYDVYLNHRRLHRTLQYRCVHCKKKFSTKNILRKHMTKHAASKTDNIIGKN